MQRQLNAMEGALTGLFDYAGLFPPASLTMRTTVQNYLEYRHDKHAWALGCMVIDVNQLHTFQEEAGSDASDLPLSIITADANPMMISRYLDEGLKIEMVEVKNAAPDVTLRLKKSLPAETKIYVEVPTQSENADALQAMKQAGIHAKLRMGGMTVEAFPTAASVAAALQGLAEKKIAFKATAGLHHPLRSPHPFTYQRNSEAGLMHGFINLLCASALVWFGGEVDDATQLLEEQDSRAWQIEASAIRWHASEWSAEELREVRERFLISIGSCSLIEPMEDLEALGWL